MCKTKCDCSLRNDLNKANEQITELKKEVGELNDLVIDLYNMLEGYEFIESRLEDVEITIEQISKEL